MLPSKDEMEKMRSDLAQYARDYPDMDALVASGKVIHKSGWYEVQDAETSVLLGKYVQQIEVSASGRLRVKMTKLDKRLAALASKT